MNPTPGRLYLAGPMSGIADHNFPRFNAVAARLRARGHTVFNPAENKDGGLRRSRQFYMQLDIPALLASEAIVVLAGWETSRGACLEVWLALDMGIPIYWCNDAASGVELEPATELDLKSLPVFASAVASGLV